MMVGCWMVGIFVRSVKSLDDLRGVETKQRLSQQNRLNQSSEIGLKLINDELLVDTDTHQHCS